MNTNQSEAPAGEGDGIPVFDRSLLEDKAALAGLQVAPENFSEMESVDHVHDGHREELRASE